MFCRIFDIGKTKYKELKDAAEAEERSKVNDCGKAILPVNYNAAESDYSSDSSSESSGTSDSDDSEDENNSRIRDKRPIVESSDSENEYSEEELDSDDEDCDFDCRELNPVVDKGKQRRTAVDRVQNDNFFKVLYYIK